MQNRTTAPPISDDYVWSTAENAVEPRGITTWTNFEIPALLAASDRNIQAVPFGTIFESACLANGTRYTAYEAVGENNFLVSAFQGVGGDLVPAAITMPEYVTAAKFFVRVWPRNYLSV